MWSPIVYFFALAGLASAIKTPGRSAPATSSPPFVDFSSDVCSKNRHNNNIFGVSKRVPNILNMRGGDVLEPASLDEVDAILLKAGSDQQLVVVDFSATWCGPCKMIAPLFSELSDEMEDVVFVKIDVDENPDTAAKYNVSAMPTFVFIKGGEVVDRLMGANPDRLREMIEEYK